MKSWRANGKLLISGEYLVLKGALALAVPTRFGQRLNVHHSGETNLNWQSIDANGDAWFKGSFDQSLEVISSSNTEASTTLQKLLKQAKKQNPNFSIANTSAVTELEFNRHWGLGSSSTLVALIAKWANVDAMELFFNCLKGSGYDVACAFNHAPIFYQIKNDKPIIESVEFQPPFYDAIHFVYLGQKQKSESEVIRFEQQIISDELISETSRLTQKIARATQLADFEALLARHEALIGHSISVDPIKSRLFENYQGSVKSLGAWGGDFMMVTGLANNPNYFQDKGYSTVLSWNEMIGM